MARLSEQLARYRAKFKEIYDPATAMGNPELLSLQTNIDNIEAQLEGHVECGDCDGWGVTECECCMQDRTCETCKGNCLLPK